MTMKNKKAQDIRRGRGADGLLYRVNRLVILSVIVSEIVGLLPVSLSRNSIAPNGNRRKYDITTTAEYKKKIKTTRLSKK
jgi:hypothetical protein